MNETDGEVGDEGSNETGRATRRAYWERELAAQAQSGQTVAAYCRAQGHPVWKFHYWQRRFRAGARAPEPGGFTQLEDTHDAARAADSPAAELRIELNGCLIHVPEPVSPARLGAILAAVRTA